jgi:hypothetical protein
MVVKKGSVQKVGGECGAWIEAKTADEFLPGADPLAWLPKGITCVSAKTSSAPGPDVSALWATVIQP